MNCFIVFGWIRTLLQRFLTRTSKKEHTTLVLASLPILVNSLKNIAELEVCIQALKKVSKSQSYVVAVGEGLDA